MADSNLHTSRRRLLLVVPATLGVLAFTGCKKKEPDSCTSTLGLTQDEIKARTALGYQDRSTDPNKHCINCKQWVAPPDIDQCGTCKVLKGPVHPKGSCNVFTPSS